MLVKVGTTKMRLKVECGRSFIFGIIRLKALSFLGLHEELGGQLAQKGGVIRH